MLSVCKSYICVCGWLGVICYTAGTATSCCGLVFVSLSWPAAKDELNPFARTHRVGKTLTKNFDSDAKPLPGPQRNVNAMKVCVLA
jgi:hypothetical protein